MMLIGAFGYVLAIVMGIPVAMYRRLRDHRAGERPASDGRE